MTMTKPTSEQITNIAAGAGAVQRTALEKFRDVVSVKDFGAVGDGVADDTAAFLAAIATIPSNNSISFGSDYVPNIASGPAIEVPPGIYKITQPLLFDNKSPCMLRGIADTGLSSSAACILEWHGASGQPLIHIDGGTGVCLEGLALYGRAISGYGVLFTRSNVGYGRGLSKHDSLSINGFTIAGIQFGLADYVNLDQTDNLLFTNIAIHSCYDGIMSVNRNNLNIHFVNLSVFASYPMPGISPRTGIRLIEGGMDVHGLYIGGGTGIGTFSDFCIYLENAYINVVGGYTEDEKFIKADFPNPLGAVITSTIVGFNQYPATTLNPGIYWNQGGNTLSWYGGRVTNFIEEGPNSGGILFTNTLFHNQLSPQTWLNRTEKSACVNCKVIRTASASTWYTLNWLGKSAGESCIADGDYMLSNNVQMRDNTMSRYADIDSVVLRLLLGEMRLYQAASGGSGFYNQNYTSFSEFFRAGNNASGPYFGNATNFITWGISVPNSGTWTQGDVRWKSDVAAGGSPGWMCTTSGTFSSASTTGNITTGTTALTVASSSGFSVGDYITIAGVTGIKRITAISGTAVTINSNADATVTGAAVATPDPVFKAMANVAA